MPYSYDIYNGDGSNTVFTIPCDYLSKSHLSVKVDGVDVDFEVTGEYQVTLDSPPVIGAAVRVGRSTPKDAPIVDFEDGATLDDEDLDTATLQSLYISQESEDTAEDSLRLDTDGEYNAQGNTIKNLGDPTEDTDAVTKRYADYSIDATAENVGLAQAARDETVGLRDDTLNARDATYQARDETFVAKDLSLVAKGDAETAATTAQQVLSQMAYPDVLNLTVVDSPYTVDETNLRNNISVDTSGGDVVLNVDPSLTEPFSFRVKKETGDNFSVTINLQATEEFKDGTTSKVISSKGGVDLTLDTSTSPDTWATSSFGASSGEAKEQLFVDGVDYTKDTTTTLTITNTPVPVSSAALSISMGGVYFTSDAYTYNPSTGVITFDEPIYSDQVMVQWSAGSLAIGVTGDGTVSFAKFASGLFISSLSEVLTTATNKIARISDLFDYVHAAGSITQTKVVTKNTADSTSTLIPADNTIPQNTEGKEYLTMDFTPKFANSKLLVEAFVPVVDNTGTNTFTLALFKDSEANAFAASCTVHTNHTYLQQSQVVGYIDAVDTSTKTFKLRFGSGAGVATIGQAYNGGSELYSTVKNTIFKVTEIKQ